MVPDKAVDSKYIRPFSTLRIEDIPEVGGKNASLGEMYNSLSSRGVKIPNGFAVTASAYRYFIEHNHLHEIIRDALAELDTRNVEQLQTLGAKIRQWIMRGEMPEDLQQQIRVAYKKLSAEYGHSCDVAIRSSATAEDLPTASFAGQQDTFLNIRGTDNLILTCKRVFASLFTNRAISYREDHGFDHMSVALSIGVQKMVRADKGASGVMFTLDTESGFRDVVFITGVYGLGENIVQGTVDPDEFLVFKPTMNKGFAPIIRRQLGKKQQRMVYGTDAMADISVSNQYVSKPEREKFCISDDEVLELARYAITIEQYYSEKNHRPMPMDIEWARDGEDGQLYIVQARPETVESTKSGIIQEVWHLDQTGQILVSGKSVGSRIASGQVRIIMNTEHMHELQPGEVLVTDITDPDWEPVMKIASAIITNRGGRTCHAAIVARELGIPAIVGTGNATRVLENRQEVTVDCSRGDNGHIYAGRLEFTKSEYEIDTSTSTQTRLMLNIGNPDHAFEHARLPHNGAGLVRLEFIINNSIGVHPRALLEYDSLDPAIQEKISSRITGYGTPDRFYVSKLSQGVGTIAAGFYPEPVIVRMSDFKSNEYAALLAGHLYEPEEENPMIGFRGASRYPSDAFVNCFRLECEALKTVRETMGLDNVKVMLPFVRTVHELKQVLAIMKDCGLERGVNGLEIMLMCELPANALLADEFLEHVDGFSIGSNDLTQLTLGVDRDSGLLSGYDERNPAVLKLMKMAIEACLRSGKYVGICGQAPSDFPEITRWLVEQNISSLSLNPDSFLKMRNIVLQLEESREKASV